MGGANWNSLTRKEVLDYLERNPLNAYTPGDIAKKLRREMGGFLEEVSEILYSLVEEDLVFCKNPEAQELKRRYSYSSVEFRVIEHR